MILFIKFVTLSVKGLKPDFDRFIFEPVMEGKTGF